MEKQLERVNKELGEGVSSDDIKEEVKIENNVGNVEETEKKEGFFPKLFKKGDEKEGNEEAEEKLEAGETVKRPEKEDDDISNMRKRLESLKE